MRLVDLFDLIINLSFSAKLNNLLLLGEETALSTFVRPSFYATIE